MAEFTEGSSARDVPDGWERRERSFRGISRRLAAHYLRNLGGTFVDADDPAEATEVAADDWRAALSTGTVSPAGSIELTEVRVAFVGDPEILPDLVESFAQKAMRAGG